MKYCIIQHLWLTEMFLTCFPINFKLSYSSSLLKNICLPLILIIPKKRLYCCFQFQYVKKRKGDGRWWQSRFTEADVTMITEQILHLLVVRDKSSVFFKRKTCSKHINTFYLISSISKMIASVKSFLLSESNLLKGMPLIFLIMLVVI